MYDRCVGTLRIEVRDWIKSGPSPIYTSKFAEGRNFTVEMFVEGEKVTEKHDAVVGGLVVHEERHRIGSYRSR